MDPSLSSFLKSSLAGFLFVGAAAPDATADILYGIRAGNILVRIDTSTLAATDVGTVAGFSSIGGLAFGNDRRLYGIDTTSDVLVRIDTMTGAGTRVGSVGVMVTFSTGLGNDPTSDLLYGVRQGGVGFSSFLVTYSKTTGMATDVGDTRAAAIVGLEFDASGQLWGIEGGTPEELIKIDKTNGNRTVIGPNGLAAFPSIGCFDIGPSGAFWAVNSPGAAYQLLFIDPMTGAPTVLGNLTGIAVSGVLTGLASERLCIGASAEVTRLGTPANPNVFRQGVTSPPVVGKTWDPFIDHTSFFPNAIVDLMLITPTTANTATPFGTLLCNVGGPFLFQVKATGARFAVNIPPGCTLVGARLATQGVSLTAVATAGLTNALDIVIGTF